MMWQADERLTTLAKEHNARAAQLAIKPFSSWAQDVSALFSMSATSVKHPGRQSSRSSLARPASASFRAGRMTASSGGMKSFRTQASARTRRSATAARSVHFAASEWGASSVQSISGDSDNSDDETKSPAPESVFVSELDALQPRHMLSVHRLRLIATRAARLRLLRLLNCQQALALRITVEVCGETVSRSKHSHSLHRATVPGNRHLPANWIVVASHR